MFTVAWWQKRLYPHPEDFDAMSVFRRMLRARVGPDSRVLDIGAGAGELNAYALKGSCREIVGVDLDPRVVDNPLLDRGLVGSAAALPLADESFDVAFSIYVLEHVADPAGFVAELRRVLKPGGCFLAIAPNRHHYVAQAAKLTPDRFHAWFRRTHYQVAEEDTFGVYYRLNTRAELRRHFEAGGFETVEVRTFETTPNYLTFSVPTFLLGTLYERLVSRCEGWADFRTNILCDFRKPADAGENK